MNWIVGEPVIGWDYDVHGNPKFHKKDREQKDRWKFDLRVLSIGRKYVTVVDHPHTAETFKFDRFTGRTNTNHHNNRWSPVAYIAPTQEDADRLIQEHMAKRQLDKRRKEFKDKYRHEFDRTVLKANDDQLSRLVALFDEINGGGGNEAKGEVKP